MDFKFSKTYIQNYLETAFNIKTALSTITRDCVNLFGAEYAGRTQLDKEQAKLLIVYIALKSGRVKDIEEFIYIGNAILDIAI